MEPKYLEIFNALPKPPKGSTFNLLKLEKVALPHPYCITPKHVAVAADHFSGMLGEAAMEAAERYGAKCGWERCQLSYKEHVSNLTLFVEVENNRGDLNKITGLGAYLTSLKPKLEEYGIEGIALPNKGGR
jgi:hypothetical protein